ncbi:MAG: hypothetical protein KAU21_08270, partial [Gammaproteobacteria bacterium]|nr:hypothetical protein [Gammaproteobacteria bacterium]
IEGGIVRSAALKLNALCAYESLLRGFEWLYCECSFLELYSGQKLAPDIIRWLADKGYLLEGVYNTLYDSKGLAIQSDFVFHRSNL